MEVLQYIYTSWKNGDSTDKGYMIYSKSEGITEAECIAIKDAMQYVAPKELNLAPTPEEIADVFPYSFAYFVLPTGRGCVAQSTYLGKDYSGRFGNYIIYAMIFDIEELPCRPSEFFGEAYIKTAMTEEELNASSPVPPLPSFLIEEYGSVIHDDQLNEFIFEKEDEFSHVLAMLLKARDLGIPFYLNDTRENLVLWSAAIQRALSPNLSKKFTFNTYMYDQEIMRSARVKESGLEFYLIGVRPDANYFNYATECMSNRHLVMDFLGGHMSEGVVPTAFTAAMASSLSMDFEEIDEFGAFVDSTTFNEINRGLQDAYVYYRLLKYNEYEHSEENLKSILSFGTKYCSESDNADVGGKLLTLLQEEGCAVAPELMRDFWNFIGKYASYMIFTLYDLLQETLFQYSGDATEPCVQLNCLLEGIEQDTPQQYKEYLDYLNSAPSVDHLMLYLDGHQNLYTNCFYLQWILKHFKMQDVLSNPQPISKLLTVLIKNISSIDGSEEMMIELLIDASVSSETLRIVLKLFADAFRDAKRLDRLSECYLEASNHLSENQTNQLEKMLLEIPEAKILVTHLLGKKIEGARKPEDEFWQFYEQHRMRMMSDPEFSIDAVAYTCLNRLDANQRSEVAAEMLRKIKLELFRDPDTIRLLTDSLNEGSFKFLSKLDTSVLRRACELRNKVAPTGLEKIKAMLVGRKLDDSYSEGKRPSSLSVEMSEKEALLAYFEKSDYEAYVKNYLDGFMVQLSSAQDVSLLMKIFYHQDFFGSFLSDYVSVIKKMEKKEQSRQLHIVAWTCIYLLSAPTDDSAADDLYQPFVHYLRSLDEDDLKKVSQVVSKSVPKARWEQMLDEIRRKEGFSEKFSGFFRRK